MRCLFCGKPLALLKRMRGGGEFCSEEHKQRYQEEYDRIALSRLLQAQKKTPKSDSAKARPAAETAEEPVAEQPVQKETEAPRETAPLLVETPAMAAESGPAAPAPAAVEKPTVETPAMAPLPAPATPVPTAEEPVLEQPKEPEAIAPCEPATFLVKKPAAAVTPEPAPYVESWTLAAPAPAIAELRLDPSSLALGEAGFLGVKLAPKVPEPEPAWLLASATSQELIPAQFAPVLPAELHLASAASHPQQREQLLAMDVPVRTLAAVAGGIQAIDFRAATELRGMRLFDFAPGPIEFPKEDSMAGAQAETAVLPAVEPAADRHQAAVRVSEDSAAKSAESLVRDAGPVSPATVSAPPAPTIVPPVAEEQPKAEPVSPRAALDALSKLHENVLHLEAARKQKENVAAPKALAKATAPADQPVETPRTASIDPAAPAAREERAAVSSPPSSAPPANSENDSATAAQQPVPREANNLLGIPVKIFTPSKRAALGVTSVPARISALLPRLKALPLRPKVAAASENAVPPDAAPKAKPGTPVTSAPEPAGVESVPPGSTATRSAEAPAQTKLAPAAKAGQPTHSVLKAAAPTRWAEATRTAKSDAPAAAANASTGVKAASPSAAAQPRPSAAMEPGASKSGRVEIAQKAEPTGLAAAVEILPSFGAIGRPSTNFWASLKVKVGIAALVIAGCSAAYFTLGAKSRPPSPSRTPLPADAAAQSVIPGEGGWTLGWGKGSSDSHSDLEFTIYRPSLQLSDYRIEFQGDIETKSLGWIFRASDAEDYYLMKLTMVSSKSASKVALYKYVVAKGRQTEAGRVPIELEVKNDTVFHVRVDVHGNKFSTTIQGQPVDVWTDGQLKSGGVGFLNEHGERGRIKSVSIRSLTGENR